MTKAKARVLAVLAGLCVMLFCWLELSYVLSRAVQSPRLAGSLAALGAAALGCLTVAVWLRNARAGAVLQIALLLPGVVGMFVAYRWRGPHLSAGDDVDLGFLLGIVIVAVIPGALLSAALLVLSRMRSRRR